MVESYKLSRNDLHFVTNDSGNAYIAEACHPSSNALLGFIRYTGKKGVVELTMFNARLSRKALDIGISAKREIRNLAGAHGEGFKLASLVMVRCGHQVRLESSGYYWNFHFRGKDRPHLYCQLTPMKPNELKEQKGQAPQNLPRKIKSHI